MPDFVLLHQGQCIPLVAGDTLVGRGLSCQIRFNDPSVSREHLRLVVAGGRVVAVNLSASNGTFVNGVVLAGPRQLRDGDEVRLGYRRFTLQALLDAGVEEAEEILPAYGPVVVDEDEVPEEKTRPGELGWAGRPREPISIPVPAPAPPTISAARLADIRIHTCPRCRAQIPFLDHVCPKCSYAWPADHPSSVTQQIKISGLEARRHPRYSIDLPVVYSSESLTIDAMIRDLSRGGMFIASELLDPVGTPCELRALPDGHAALLFTGVVAHVSADGTGGKAIGFGIRLVGGEPASQRWLERTLGMYESAVGDDL